MDANSTLWKLLWDFDPNGLLVVDKSMTIKLVNAALCRMLHADIKTIVGRNAEDLLGDVRDLRRALSENTVIVGNEQAYPQYDLYVRKVIFPVPGENVVAGIFVDMTDAWKQRCTMTEMRRRVIEEVRQVVDKQMNVAQEIAGLLGETTAETKVGLLRLTQTLQDEPK